MEPRPKEAETETISFESIQAEPWGGERVLNKHLWEQQHGICVYQGHQKTPQGHFQCQHFVYFSSVFRWCSKGEQKLRSPLMRLFLIDQGTPSTNEALLLCFNKNCA